MLSRGMFALSGYQSLPPVSAPQPPKDALLNLLRRDFLSWFFLLFSRTVCIPKDTWSLAQVLPPAPLLSRRFSPCHIDPLGLLCELEMCWIWEQSKLESWQKMRKGDGNDFLGVCVGGGVGG